MPGSEPGVPAAASVGPDGSVTYIDPATAAAYASLPAGSPGAMMLEGPQAPPPAPAQVRQVFTRPVTPGVPGRLVKLPGGGMAVTPSGLVAAAPMPGPPPILTDPPLGADVLRSMPDGTIVVAPLPASYNGDDGQTITAALQQVWQSPLQTYPAGGVVRLMSGRTYNCASTITIPYGCFLDGNGAIIVYTGGGAAVYAHAAASLGFPPFVGNLPAGGGWGFTIDGSNAGPNARGLDYGDGTDFFWDRIRIYNFNGAGAVGAQEVNFNPNSYTEKSKIRLQILNCTQAFATDCNVAMGAAQSHEYNEYDLHIGVGTQQNGIVLKNGSHLSNTRIRVIGNFYPKNNNFSGVGLDLSHNDGNGNYSFIARSWIDFGVEVTPEGGTITDSWQTLKFGSNNGNFLLTSYGRLIFLGNQWTNSDAVEAQFSFGGVIYGDTSLAALATTTGNKPPGWA